MSFLINAHRSGAAPLAYPSLNFVTQVYSDGTTSVTLADCCSEPSARTASGLEIRPGNNVPFIIGSALTAALASVGSSGTIVIDLTKYATFSNDIVMNDVADSTEIFGIDLGNPITPTDMSQVYNYSSGGGSSTATSPNHIASGAAKIAASYSPSGVAISENGSAVVTASTTLVSPAVPEQICLAGFGSGVIYSRYKCDIKAITFMSLQPNSALPALST